MKTEKEVLALLVALGKTKDEVAEKLFVLGIRGKRGKCLTCPIAQYLIENGVDARVGVWAWGLGVVGVVGVGGFYYYSIDEYPAIIPIRDFILAVDQGEYPQLEMP
jgi:hypothetical protein